MNQNTKVIIWYNVIVSVIFLLIIAKLFEHFIFIFGLLIGLFLGAFNLLAALITVFKNRKLASLFLLLGLVLLLIGIGVCSKNPIMI